MEPARRWSPTCPDALSLLRAALAASRSAKRPDAHAVAQRCSLAARRDIERQALGLQLMHQPLGVRRLAKLPSCTAQPRAPLRTAAIADAWLAHCARGSGDGRRLSSVRAGAAAPERRHGRRRSRTPAPAGSSASAAGGPPDARCRRSGAGGAGAPTAARWRHARRRGGAGRAARLAALPASRRSPCWSPGRPRRWGSGSGGSAAAAAALEACACGPESISGTISTISATSIAAPISRSLTRRSITFQYFRALSIRERRRQQPATRASPAPAPRYGTNRTRRPDRAGARRRSAAAQRGRDVSAAMRRGAADAAAIRAASARRSCRARPRRCQPPVIDAAARARAAIAAASLSARMPHTASVLPAAAAARRLLRQHARGVGIVRDIQDPRRIAAPAQSPESAPAAHRRQARAPPPPAELAGAASSSSSAASAAAALRIASRRAAPAAADPADVQRGPR